jgi:hypothetical protein
VKAKTGLNWFSEHGNEYSHSPNAWNILIRQITAEFSRSVQCHKRHFLALIKLYRFSQIKFLSKKARGPYWARAKRNLFEYRTRMWQDGAVKIRWAKWSLLPVNSLLWFAYELTCHRTFHVNKRGSHSKLFCFLLLWKAERIGASNVNSSSATVAQTVMHNKAPFIIELEQKSC